MIYKGNVKLFAQNGFPYTQYSKGDCVGESDALLGLNRDSKATTQEESILYVLKLSSINPILDQFPKQKKKLHDAAVQKRHQHRRKIIVLEKRFPVYGVAVNVLT